MPADALPVPWPAPLAGVVHYRREYRDILGRPMRGKVTITGTTPTETASSVVLPVAVTVELANGVLEVDLPPDTYRLAATLRTADGDRASDTGEVVLA